MKGIDLKSKKDVLANVVESYADYPKDSPEGMIRDQVKVLNVQIEDSMLTGKLHKFLVKKNDDSGSVDINFTAVLLVERPDDKYDLWGFCYLYD